MSGYLGNNVVTVRVFKDLLTYMVESLFCMELRDNDDDDDDDECTC